MSQEWTPPNPDWETEGMTPRIETPNGHHVDGAFDMSSLVSEPAPAESQEAIPNPKAGKRSFKDWFVGKPKQKKEKVRKPTPPMPRNGIAAALTNVYTGLGMTVAMADRHCGMAIVESAEDCGQAWEDLARRNPKVRRALLMFLETSDVTKVIIAHAPIMAAVFAHHAPLGDAQVSLIEQFANQTANEGGTEE